MLFVSKCPSLRDNSFYLATLYIMSPVQKFFVCKKLTWLQLSLLVTIKESTVCEWNFHE